MVMARLPLDRGISIDIAEWWWEMLEMALEGETANQTALAIKLSAAAGRVPAWDRSKVTTFLQRKNTTVEMALAFSKLYPTLPRVVFYPRTRAEAVALEATSSRFPEPEPPTPDHSRAATAYDAAADELERSADDHMRTLSSGHGKRRADRGGPRSSAGRGPKTTGRRP